MLTYSDALPSPNRSSDLRKPQRSKRSMTDIILVVIKRPFLPHQFLNALLYSCLLYLWGKSFTLYIIIPSKKHKANLHNILALCSLLIWYYSNFLPGLSEFHHLGAHMSSLSQNKTLITCLKKLLPCPHVL